MEAYKQAVFEKDVEAFLALYDQHVRVFDTWGIWAYEGKPAWRKMAEEWFSSLGTERVKVTFEDVRATGDASSLAIVSAFVTYAGLSAQDEELHSMQNRLTWALKVIDNEWKVVHEHTSAPVDFSDGKAILSRTDPA